MKHLKVLNPSASQLDTLAECNGSLFLPRYENTGPEAIRGTLTHKYIELRNKGLDELAEQHKSRHAHFAKFWSALPLDEIGSMFRDLRHEVTFWYDPVSGAVGISETDDRSNLDYMYGRCDAYGYLRDSDQMVVVDYKTGYPVIGEATYKLQLRFFAMVLHKLGMADTVRAVYIYLEEEGGYQPDVADFEYFDHVETENIIKKIVSDSKENAARTTPRLMSGPHCKYCPSYQGCPNTTSLISNIAGIIGSEPPVNLTAPLNDDTLAESWRFMRRAKMLVEKAEEQLKDYAKVVGEFDIGKGYVVRATKRGVIESRKK